MLSQLAAAQLCPNRCHVYHDCIYSLLHFFLFSGPLISSLLYYRARVPFFKFCCPSAEAASVGSTIIMRSDDDDGCCSCCLVAIPSWGLKWHFQTFASVGVQSVCALDRLADLKRAPVAVPFEFASFCLLRTAI